MKSISNTLLLLHRPDRKAGSDIFPGDSVESIVLVQKLALIRLKNGYFEFLYASSGIYLSKRIIFFSEHLVMKHLVMKHLVMKHLMWACQFLAYDLRVSSRQVLFCLKYIDS